MTLLQKARRLSAAASLSTIQIISGSFLLGAGAIATATPAAACSDGAYMGAVCFIATDFCPEGFLAANGQSLAISTNQALYSLLGFRFGGSGQSFNLPDLRARSPLGSGQSPDAGVASAVAAGQKLGQQTVTMTSNQVAPHVHQASLALTSGSQTVNIPAVPSTLGVDVSLKAKSTNGANALLPDSYLAQGGVGPNAAPIYNPTPPAGTADVSLKGLSASLTGNVGQPAFSFNVTVPTSGTVTVQPNQVAAVPIATQTPGLGLTACISTGGLYPPRP
ncbi:tail fiber protein [Agrobacterium rubi]|uniref:phage tail protein n=1 Tax=Agrobacterium rubi TaxID=28099 RepID=UPI001572EF08|nr:tail fiber protein [Agrobacterium rubi]NTF10861.1 tail fiber protein [Agrobacterium rubi]NTF21132.1 tail fiber protein [Agrobacterium rubi]NTF30197.1 tail fiber protein [Agrobacterium rubi]